jgi:hypothetical protein
MRWSPQDFYADPVVARMAAEQRWRYREALDFSWMGDTPGVGPEDEWRKLLGYSAAEWESQREVFAGAFAIEGELWIQRRMVDEVGHARARSEHGGVGARHRWMPGYARAMLGHARAMQTQIKTKTEEEPKDSPPTSVGDEPPVPARNGTKPRASRPKPSQDWMESFGEHFWPAYPRHEGKADALSAWGKLGLTPEAMAGGAEFFNRVMDALERWKGDHADDGPKFIPYPATWINRRPWEDSPR